MPTTTCIRRSTPPPQSGRGGRDIDRVAARADAGPGPLEAADILMIDNYDSFTHNVVDALRQLGPSVAVVRNDAVAIEDVVAGRWRAIVLSPGPGRPEEAGITVEVIRRLGDRVPILGICLGHQALAVAFGGRIVRATRPLHGTATPIHHDGTGILAGLPRPFDAARYHSLVVDPEAPGRELVVHARSAEGEIMALRHPRRPLAGVQFHPESYLSPHGPRLLAAFLDLAGLPHTAPQAVVR